VRRSPYNHHPMGPAFAAGRALLLGLVLAAFPLNAIAYADRRIGIGEGPA
jgi:hypothetical protein